MTKKQKIQESLAIILFFIALSGLYLILPDKAF